MKYVIYNLEIQQFVDEDGLMVTSVRAAKHFDKASSAWGYIKSKSIPNGRWAGCTVLPIYLK